MNRKKQRVAENSLEKIAMREGKAVSEVRKEIEKAMFIGMCSQDPAAQEYWKRIPCEGDIPTPEEVVVFLADKTKRRI